jgi:hypothetical protein
MPESFQVGMCEDEVPHLRALMYCCTRHLPNAAVRHQLDAVHQVCLSRGGTSSGTSHLVKAFSLAMIAQH